jgi:DNA phosphorothioation-dependent restriction protein DptG
MTRRQKAIAGLYASLYVAGLLIVCMDVYVWRAEEPSARPHAIQSAKPNSQ